MRSADSALSFLMLLSRPNEQSAPFLSSRPNEQSTPFLSSRPNERSAPFLSSWLNERSAPFLSSRPNEQSTPFLSSWLNERSAPFLSSRPNERSECEPGSTTRKATSFCYPRTSLWGGKAILRCLLFLAPLNAFASDLISLLQHVNAYESRFAQTTRDEEGRVISQSRGEFGFLRPGKFRWLTESPNHIVLIADGKKVYQYDKALEQVIVQPQTAVVEQSPLWFLYDPAPQQLAKYHLALANVEYCGASTQCFSVTPKDQDAAFHIAWIGFNKNILASVRFEDALGQLNDIRFSRIKQNQALPASAFTFKIPPGVEVIEND